MNKQNGLIKFFWKRQFTAFGALLFMFWGFLPFVMEHLPTVGLILQQTIITIALFRAFLYEDKYYDETPTS